MKIQIAVATTRRYRMPDDRIYLPMQVGAAGKGPIGYARDDEGENISGKNPGYCELTAMYWLWKNSDADCCGVVHYRRHFCSPGTRLPRLRPYRHILGGEELSALLADSSIILPYKRRYVIESMYSHYIHSHYEKHINAAKKAISSLCPEYLDVFTTVLKRTSGHMFNMLIMERAVFNEYCSWLFPILEELERTVDTTGYDAFQKRYLGRVAELLLDVWIEHNGKAYWEVPAVTIGRVKWGRKIASFFAAKFFGKRYTKSF